MRKVILTMDEDKKYTTIKKLVETDGNKQRAAIELDCTKRHVNRMIKGYKEKGKEYFVHGNKGRRPVHALEYEIKQKVLDLYRTKYEDANFVHYSELLEEYEHIKVSPSTIHSILINENIISTKATRNTRKNLAKKLKELLKTVKTKKEISYLQNTIIEIEDAHPRRPRCAYFGEMLQMDASLHNWFGQDKCQLHIAVDDATGSILGAYFDGQETLNGYYNILYQVLNLRVSPIYPELKGIHRQIKKRCILDGELIVIKDGKPDFTEMQRRSLMTNKFRIELAASKLHVSFTAYDILYLDGRILTDLPLIKRKDLLQKTVKENDRLAISRYIEEKGIDLYSLTVQQNLEGIVAKPSNVVSIVLGQYRSNQLTYKGHVTMGVNKEDFSNIINTKRIEIPQFSVPKGNENAIWIDPKLFCTVNYMTKTETGGLRQPVFKGLRDDKTPLECIEII